MSSIIEECLLHDFKKIVNELQTLKERIMTLEDICDDYHGKIKLPHRCPICNGSMHDEEGAMCFPCDGRGIVWG